MNRLHGSRGAATPLEEDKAQLRAKMRGVRKRLFSSDPGAGEALARVGVSRVLSHFDRPGVVAAYVRRGSEIDPAPLLAVLRSAGWVLALPRGMAFAAPLEFRDADGLMRPDVFGVSAPSERAARLTPDLVLVPVLAFDARGGRLGQGAGCYDRTLSELRETGSVLAVGLAFAGQQIERVPTDDRDAPLDLILTERGPVDVIRAAR